MEEKTMTVSSGMTDRGLDTWYMIRQVLSHIAPWPIQEEFAPFFFPSSTNTRTYHVIPCGLWCSFIPTYTYHPCLQIPPHWILVHISLIFPALTRVDAEYIIAASAKRIEKAKPRFREGKWGSSVDSQIYRYIPPTTTIKNRLSSPRAASLLLLGYYVSLPWNCFTLCSFLCE